MARPDDDKIRQVQAWKDPERRTSYDWDSIATQLRAHPMEWALVFEQGRTSLVNALRQNKVAALSPAWTIGRRPSNTPGFEVETRNNQREPVRVCDLYLRWNPGEES